MKDFSYITLSSSTWFTSFLAFLAQDLIFNSLYVDFNKLEFSFLKRLISSIDININLFLELIACYDNVFGFKLAQVGMINKANYFFNWSEQCRFALTHFVVENSFMEYYNTVLIILRYVSVIYCYVNLLSENAISSSSYLRLLNFIMTDFYIYGFIKICSDVIIVIHPGSFDNANVDLIIGQFIKK